MKKIKILNFILIITIILFANGCNNRETSKEEDTQSSSNVTIIKQEVPEIQEEDNKTKDKDTSSSESKTPSKDNENKVTEKVSKNITLHYVDDNTLKPINLVKIEIDDSKSLRDKLQLTANEISKRYFFGLPIEVKSVSNTANGQIAIINLKESSENEKAWNRNFFQGSTGGIVTSTLLKENLLQRNYEGKWVDGIQFTYEGEEIEYQHVEVLQNGPFMRK